jgi:hypothetical protein
MMQESDRFLEAQTQLISEDTVKARSPAQTMRQMAGGFAMTQVLHAAAQSGIADELRDEARNVEHLAGALKLDPHALERFLRMMVVLELLVQQDTGVFSLSALGQLLRADHPESMRDRILFIGAVNYPAASAVLHSVRTGQPAFDHVFGMPFFDYLAGQPALGGLFNGLMKQGVYDRISSILQVYDFSQARRIVDIGGGNGALLSSVLTQVPSSAGAIFDTASVIAEARTRLAETELARRVDLVEGDLFEGGYPQGADLYLLSNVIHDWNDAQAETILRHCVSAMPPCGSLMLIEELMPERVADSPATIANDYSMLILTGGRERSEAHYRALLDRSGMLIASIIPVSVKSADSIRVGNWALLMCRAK